MSRRRLISAGVALALTVAACGSDPAGPDQSSQAEVTTTSRPTTSSAPASESTAPPTDGGAATTVAPPAEVPDFLQFTAADAAGGPEIDGSIYAGTDLVLWFWAPW